MFTFQDFSFKYFMESSIKNRCRDPVCDIAEAKEIDKNKKHEQECVFTALYSHGVVEIPILLLGEPETFQNNKYRT